MGRKTDVHPNQTSLDNSARQGPDPGARLRPRTWALQMDSTLELSGPGSSLGYRGNNLAATRRLLRLRILYYQDCTRKPETGVGLPMTFCTLPPEGWSCSREPGHEGACAAIPKDSLSCDPVLRVIPFCNGTLVFCENSMWFTFPQKPRPWYNKLWRKIWK